MCSFISRDTAGKAHCVEMCPEKRILTAVTGQMECVAFCPTEAPFSLSGVCAESCPWLVDVASLSCVSVPECALAGKFVLDSYCVSGCPDGYFL